MTLIALSREKISRFRRYSGTTCNGKRASHEGGRGYLRAPGAGAYSLASAVLNLTTSHHAILLTKGFRRAKFRRARDPAISTSKCFSSSAGAKVQVKKGPTAPPAPRYHVQNADNALLRANRRYAASEMFIGIASCARNDEKSAARVLSALCSSFSTARRTATYAQRMPVE